MDVAMEPLIMHLEAVVPLDVTYDKIKSNSMGLMVTDSAMVSRMMSSRFLNVRTKSEIFCKINNTWNQNNKIYESIHIDRRHSKQTNVSKT
jgi:hypothetical protein